LVQLHTLRRALARARSGKSLSLEEVADRAQEAWDYGATEVCIQGGLHPSLPGDFYFRILDVIRRHPTGDRTASRRVEWTGGALVSGDWSAGTSMAPPCRAAQPRQEDLRRCS
jgi:hypothetical protein